MTRASVGVVAIGLAMGCRFAGPEGDPARPIADAPGEAAPELAAGSELDAIGAAARDADGEGVGGGAIGGGDLGGGPGSGGPVSGGDSASPDGDASEGADSADGAGGGAMAAPPGAPGDALSIADASCDPPSGLACDPVQGTGCAPLMQCVVDPAASGPAGYCVFTIASAMPACTQDPFGTSCPVSHTCIMGECRRYCYCDADCDDGSACADPSGQGGSDAFKLCSR